MNDLPLTVVTATVGNSTYLAKQMEELRRFTRLPFRQIVSDDGTAYDYAKDTQKTIVGSFAGAEWTENPGPTYGISYNLNHAFSLVKTPWAFVIEDAVRPGWGWLETALDALEKLSCRSWRGREVAAIGMASSFDAWELAAAGVLPGNLKVLDYFGRADHETINNFFAAENDGLLCWPRLLPAIQATCGTPEARYTWPEIIQRTWRKPILENRLIADQHIQTDRIAAPFFQEWPQHRWAWPAGGPSAWCLVNMDAWRKVGGWREGCCFYEAHLGIRLTQAGYLCVNVDCPPWLHFPSLAFNAIAYGMGKEPRRNRVDLGETGIFAQDFGAACGAEEGLKAFFDGVFPENERGRIAVEMAGSTIYADPAWLRYT